jgi:hypothetical protein
MKSRLSSALLAVAFVVGILAVASPTAEAQWRNNDDSRYRNGVSNQEFNQGFQYGANTGASDAQRNQTYSPQRSRYYRNARSQAFQQGFVRGYDQTYRQYARNGGYSNGGVYSNGGYRNDGYYGNGGNGGNGGYESQELNRGYQQGINTGASDGQSRKSYSPQRSRYYQNASSQAFREGFVRGYDQGYRQYSGNTGYRTNNIGTILGQILGRP